MPLAPLRAELCLLLLIPLLVASAPAAALTAAETNATLSVVRVYFEQPDDVRALTGFDLWEYVGVDEGYLLVLVDPAEFADLATLGLRIELDELRTAEVRAPRTVSPTQVTGIPGFPCYQTVEETYLMAEHIVADHPGLASWIDVGDSWEKANGLGGFDLRVLRLTNAAQPGPKPKLFITSSIHAREYAPAGLVARFAEHLVDQYGSDADVTWILDHHEIHLMLQANPDGRKKAETGLYWRKNTNQDHCSPTSNDRGADLNRNFEFEWGCCGGSSGWECNELYRGPFAASEPETQAVQNYLLTEFPDQKPDPPDSPVPDDATGIYIDIHASGNLLLWPWSFGGNSPNSAQLRTLGRKLAYFNGYEPQQGVDLYPADGTTMDFGYGEQGVAALAYELGTQYFQQCSYFENVILPENLPSLLYAAKVVRTPYQTPAGPDALQVGVAPEQVYLGESFELTATLDDTRYENGNGAEPTQRVADAEYYVDLPPWVDGSPAPTGMAPLDGTFDATIEQVTAVVGTTGFSPGRQIVFVRGRDGDGNWGSFGAAFITVIDDQADDDGDGVANGDDCDAGDGSVWAVPSPAFDLRVSKLSLGNLTWSPPAEPGAQLIDYDVLRSTAPDGFDVPTCIPTGSATTTTDGTDPGTGRVLHYLVRCTNRCGDNLGADSSGRPRTGGDCPP